MSGNFEQAKAFFLQGLEHYRAGRFAQAERDYAASLALLPGRASTLTNLGAARVKLGRMQDAIDVLDEALAQEPGNAEAVGHRATALAELGRRPEALAGFEHLLQLEPGHGLAWSLRGLLLRDEGRLGEAAASFRKAIELGADPQLNGHYLAGVTGAAPPAPPRHYVEGLFDSYAEGFEQHLVDVLKYRAHELLAGRVLAAQRRYAAALDLGCGTGLCGSLVRPVAQWLEGVDLSANMVRQARARSVYDRVEQGDVVQHLAAATRRFELVLAADVFIYVGALEQVFAETTRVLEPGGLFCFSVEAAGEDEEFALRPSLRYVHSERYLRRLAAAHGFEVEAVQRHPIREDQQRPIPGLFAWLVRR
jgi:predicted TPR repeat methyltransferase